MKKRDTGAAVIKAAMDWYANTHRPNIDPWTFRERCDCPSCKSYLTLIKTCARHAARGRGRK